MKGLGAKRVLPPARARDVGVCSVELQKQVLPECVRVPAWWVGTCDTRILLCKAKLSWPFFG